MRYHESCSHKGCKEAADSRCTIRICGVNTYFCTLHRSNLRTDVVALYVDPRGPYPKLLTEWYDEKRDARTYGGPWPVIAHPSCGPWGRLRHLYRGGEGSRELALIAVEQVRRWGGVLEHPRYSQLWKFVGLPLPGEPADAYGGWTIEVAQVDWGHPARKWTWLYIVGGVPGPMPTPREPTHWISGGRGRVGKKANTTPVPAGIKVCSAQQHRRTPIAFAEWLIELASQASTGLTTAR